MATADGSTNQSDRNSSTGSQPVAAHYPPIQSLPDLNTTNGETLLEKHTLHPIHNLDVSSSSGRSVRVSNGGYSKPTLIRVRSSSSQISRSSSFRSPTGPDSLSAHEKFHEPVELIDEENRSLGRRSPLGSRFHWSAKRTTAHLIKQLIQQITCFNPTSLTVTINPASATPTTPMILRHPPSQTALPTRSRWFTIEFGVYWLVLAYSLITIINKTVALSQVDHPNYDTYKRRLSRGWILGRKIDNSDLQYRRFRSGLTQLVLLAMVYLGLSHASRRLKVTRSNFQSISSALILTALHGSSVLKIMCIMGLNFFVSRTIHTLPSRACLILVWLTNLMILFANDYWSGYQFGNLSTSLTFLDNERCRGLIPRWHIGFNISILRLISYSIDYQWASQSQFANPKPNEPEYDKERVRNSRAEAEYSFQNYFNYVFYPPLYIAGPIITFNNFISQMNKKPSTITSRAVVGYVGRFLICFFTLEWILHYMYVVAIKDSRAWQGDTPLELGIIGYWNLIIIWLKLLIPWRFFRLWALLDGIDPPENMIRCMSNNYSTLEFWRSWHRSYNLWIVRYLYIPLGGSKNMILSTVIVFTFVALWHDLSFKLLTWGWLVSFFVLPEVIAKKVFSNSNLRDKPWFRPLVALGGTLNVMTMMSANLVGFSIGTDGVKLMWNELLSSWSGLKILFAILFVVFCAVNVMMEYRQAEANEGIFRKC